MDEQNYEDYEDDFIDDEEEELSFDGYDRRGWQRLDKDEYEEEEDEY